MSAEEEKTEELPEVSKREVSVYVLHDELFSQVVRLLQEMPIKDAYTVYSQLVSIKPQMAVMND